jgi:pimeloyl-ACP methyl ester carboxylesterase
MMSGRDATHEGPRPAESAEKGGTPDFLAEKGSNPSILIAVFSGARGFWGSRRFEFAHTTDSLNYSRILCRDPYGVWYHDGIGGEVQGIRRLVDCMRDHIEKLAPETMLFVGNSVGGYAAMLFGHLLGADAVHAFAPQTCLLPDYVKKHRRLDRQEKVEAYDRLWASREAEWDWFDLNAVLEHHNGRTTYFVHHCEDSESDRSAAAWVAEREGVMTCTYPCGGHGVARHIAKERLLYNILRPDLEEVVAFLSNKGKLQ